MTTPDGLPYEHPRNRREARENAIHYAKMGNEWTALANFWGSLALTFPNSDTLELTSAEKDTIERLRVNNLAIVDPAFLDQATAAINYQMAERNGEVLKVGRELYSVLRAIVIHSIGTKEEPIIVHESDLRDVMSIGIKLEAMEQDEDNPELRWKVGVVRS